MNEKEDISKSFLKDRKQIQRIKRSFTVLRDLLNKAFVCTGTNIKSEEQADLIHHTIEEIFRDSYFRYQCGYLKSVMLHATAFILY